MGFACEDDEFVMFVIIFFEGSNVNFEVPGVAFTEPFDIRASCSDEFVDALTGTVSAKRKVLRTSLGNACIMAKQARRNTTSVTGSDRRETCRHSMDQEKRRKLRLQ